MNITKGQGYWSHGDDEIFTNGKDWLIWSWRDQCGRYFHNKSEAKRYIKFVEAIRY